LFLPPELPLPLLTPRRHLCLQEDEGVLTFQSLLDFRLPVYIAKFAPKREKKPKGSKGAHHGQQPGPRQSHSHSQGLEGPAGEQGKPAGGAPAEEAPAERKDEAGPDDAAGAPEE
jgi:hypothetical protein